ncbi:hypothetical protein PoB_001458900 [Plakobranchus ocellatus]|uniref:Glutaminase n=1 Tax=Plakobranchus ocellatus TaxID=259542 RepID=A0AAV3Z104_9GAST|nr:hypothetical protein PoB_001458900 [Plakobranchus ocellatus]
MSLHRTATGSVTKSEHHRIALLWQCDQIRTSPHRTATGSVTKSEHHRIALLLLQASFNAVACYIHGEEGLAFNASAPDLFLKSLTKALTVSVAIGNIHQTTQLVARQTTRRNGREGMSCGRARIGRGPARSDDSLIDKFKILFVSINFEKPNLSSTRHWNSKRPCAQDVALVFWFSVF